MVKKVGEGKASVNDIKFVYSYLLSYNSGMLKMMLDIALGLDGQWAIQDFVSQQICTSESV